MKCEKIPCFPTRAHTQSKMADGGIGSAGTTATPVFTENRIVALRNHLRALMKALKVGYAEATATEATQKQRDDANLLVDKFTESLGEVEDEYRKSIVTTDDVVFAANNLLAELQAYRAVLGERYPKIGTASDAAAEERLESGEAAIDGATAAPGSGVVHESSTREKETGSVLSAIGEKETGSFALPQRPPATPRTPRTPSRATGTAPVYQLAPAMNASTTSAAASTGDWSDTSKFARAIDLMNRKIKDRPTTGVGVGAQTSFASLPSVVGATPAGAAASITGGHPATEVGSAALETSSQTLVGGQEKSGAEGDEAAPKVTPEMAPNAALTEGRQAAGREQSQRRQGEERRRAAHRRRLICQCWRRKRETRT